MKIAYVIENFYPLSQTFVRDLAVGLAKTHNVCVFTAKKEVRDAEAEGLDVRVVRASPRQILQRRIRKLGNRLSRRGVAYRDAEWENIIRSKTEAFRGPLTDFEPNIIYADFGWTSEFLLPIAKAFGCPIITHFHGSDASSALAKRPYREAMKKVLGDSSSTVIVPSRHLERRLQVACGGSPEIEIVPYGPVGAVAKGGSTNEGPLSFCAIGRLVEKKNPVALVEAFAILKGRMEGVHLDIVGSGPLEPEVAKRIAERGLTDSVTLHGALPHTKTLEQLSEADFFVQHSVTASNGDQEGLPVAILEALIRKIPVISTIHSGIPEVVEHGINGYLVREHDFVEMAKYMEKAAKRARSEWVFQETPAFTQERRLVRVNEILKAASSRERASVAATRS